MDVARGSSVGYARRSMRMQRDLLRLSRAIHAQPELAFEEHAAQQLLVEAVRKAGLDVEAGAYGLETAFASEFGAQRGRASRCSPSTTRCPRSVTPAATT